MSVAQLGMFGSEYALEAHSIPVVPGPAGVCHACGRAVPEGFTDACRACVLKRCEAQNMEMMRCK